MAIRSKALSLILSAVLALCLSPAVAITAFADNEQATNSSVDAITPSVKSVAVNISPKGDHGTGAMPDSGVVRSIHDANAIVRNRAANLPAKYSSVEAGNVTPVVNQGTFGTCWAFSTIAAAESSILSKGLAESVDLSERHLSYFSYRKAADPLGGTDGDGTTALTADFSYIFNGSSNPYLATGGNGYLTLQALASWKGVANEDVAPYEELLEAFEDIDWEKPQPVEDFLSQTALSDNLAFQDSYHLQNGLMIPMTDREDVKNAVIEHGAVAISYNSSQSDDYYNPENSAWYNKDAIDTDHMVALVGWDDNYSKTNFGNQSSEQGSSAKPVQPKNDGAWLCKNSWGSTWGNDGYFWLSYEDATMNDYWARAYVYEMENADDFDNIYQYDGSSGSCYNILPSGGSIANIFTTHANAKGGEALRKVGISLFDVNVDYSIQIYVNPSSPDDPTSGSPILSSPVKGKTSYEGYYTIDLGQDILLPENTQYAVVATLSHSNGDDVNYAVDNTYDMGWARHDNAFLKGQSFSLFHDTDTWYDISGPRRLSLDEDGCNARIKAFTKNVSTAPTLSFPINSADVKVESVKELSAGSVIAEVGVTYGGARLVEGKDYTYESHYDANTSTLTVNVSGKGVYSGVKTIVQKWESHNISFATIEVVNASYAGKSVTPSPIVKLFGKTLHAGIDYNVSYFNNSRPGTATLIISGINGFIGTKSAAFTIGKGRQPMIASVKKKTVTVKYSKLKKKKILIASPVKVTKAFGKLTYSNVSSNKKVKKFKINSKTGKIVVAKATKKGTYALKIKIAASGNAFYNKGSKTLTLKIKVK